MKKHILLALGLAAVYLAAKEYGINSLDDLKRVLKPVMKVVDTGEISHLLELAEEKTVEAVSHES